MKRLSIPVLNLALGVTLAALALPAHAENAGLDSRPVPVKTPPPDYPVSLRREGVEGTVAIKVTIDEDGNVAECVVSKSSNAEFEKPALAAVRTWKFKPATKDGAAVKAAIIIPIRFSAES